MTLPTVNVRDFARPGARGRNARAVDLPDDVVYVGRPSRYGNPYVIGAPDPVDGTPMTRERVVELFRIYARERLVREPGWLDPLMGKRLACHCDPDPSVPCHAKVLVELRDLVRDRRARAPFHARLR